MTATSSTAKLEWALRYCANGFKLIPLEGKRPTLLGKDWPGKASSDPEQIKAWAREFPGCNFGCAGGKNSAGKKLLVLDVDVKGVTDGLAQADQFLAHYGTSRADLNSFEVRTPSGGIHIYGYYEGADLSNAQGALREILGLGKTDGLAIDIRGGPGGQVAIAGSTYEGKTYTAISKTVGLNKITTWKPEIVAAVRARTKTHEHGALADTAYGGGEWFDDYPDEVAKAIRWAKSQPRDHDGASSFPVARHMRDLGMSPELATEILWTYWAEPHDLPWGRAQVHETVRNSYKGCKDRPGNATAVGKWAQSLTDQGIAVPFESEEEYRQKKMRRTEYGERMTLAQVEDIVEQDDWLGSDDDDEITQELLDEAVSGSEWADGESIGDMLDRAGLPEPVQRIFADRVIVGTSWLCSATAGTGKSTLAMLGAVSAASGVALLGGYFDPVDADGIKVILYNGEDPRETLALAFLACIQDNADTLGADGIAKARRNIKLISGMTGAEPPLSVTMLDNQQTVEDKAGVTKIRKGIETFGARMVILDPLIGITGGSDENDNKAAKTLMVALGRVAEEFNAAFYLVHHNNKGGTSRGASAFRDAARGLDVMAGYLEEGENGKFNAMLDRFGLKEMIAEKKANMVFVAQDKNNRMKRAKPVALTLGSVCVPIAPDADGEARYEDAGVLRVFDKDLEQNEQAARSRRWLAQLGGAMGLVTDWQITDANIRDQPVFKVLGMAKRDTAIKVLEKRIGFGSNGVHDGSLSYTLRSEKTAKATKVFLSVNLLDGQNGGFDPVEDDFLDV
jgi:hypothetical protein